jgi:hypothetical protein
LFNGSPGTLFNCSPLMSLLATDDAPNPLFFLLASDDAPLFDDSPPILRPEHCLMAARHRCCNGTLFDGSAPMLRLVHGLTARY